MQSNLAEDVRFELTDHFWSLVFKTSAIDRSANLPYCGGMCWIRTSWPITDHDFTDRYSRQCCSHSIVVSEKGFEPSTSWSQIKCSAKLSYSENHFKFNIKSLYITLYLMSNFITSFCVVPEAGLEPARPKSRDFKPLASTNFAIRAAICVSFQIQHKIIIHHITSCVKFLFTSFCFVVTGRIYEVFMY